MNKAKTRVVSTMIALATLSASAFAQTDNVHLTMRDICGDCTPVKYASCEGFLEGPSIAPDGSIWLSDVLGGQIFQVESNGTCHVRSSGHKLPNGTQFDRDGRLLVAHAGGIFALNTRSGATAPFEITFNGRPVTDVNDFVLADDGGMYLTTPFRSSITEPNGIVYHRDTAGEVTMIGDNFAFPNGISLTPDGEELLIANFAAKEILSYPSIGSKNPLAIAYVFARTSGGYGIDGMKFDASGRLFAANFGAGNVLVFDRVGRQIGDIRLPTSAGTMSTNIAIGTDYLYITEASKGEIWRVQLNR